MVYGNCKYWQSLATVAGIAGLCLLGCLLLNAWFITTWAMVTGIIAIWCLLASIVHENWEIDVSNYDLRGMWALWIGIDGNTGDSLFRPC